MDSRWLRCFRIVLLVLIAAARASWAEHVGPEVAISELDTLKSAPAVAYNSVQDEYVVVWIEESAGWWYVKGARLNKFGRVLTQFTVTADILGELVEPTVAFDPNRDRYLVAWAHEALIGDDHDLEGRLVGWDCAELGTTFYIWSLTDDSHDPKLAYVSAWDEFRIVWSNRPVDEKSSISWRIIDPAGVPGFAQTVVGDGVFDYSSPALAYNANRGELLVAYEVDLTNVAARRMDHDGATGSVIAIAGWPDQEIEPSAAACPDLDQWVVAWRSANDPAGNVYLRFVQGDGTLDGGPIPLATVPGQDTRPAMACSTGDPEYLVSWESLYDTGKLGVVGRCLNTNKGLEGSEMDIRSSIFDSGARDSYEPALVGTKAGWYTAWMQFQERNGVVYRDIHGAAVWHLFGDDFEAGDVGEWSASAP